MKNKKYIIGNWKMNPKTSKEATQLIKDIDKELHDLDLGNIYVGIAPPFPFISNIDKQSSNVNIGAQDVFWKRGGAFTGEVSASQIKSVGADFVIVGHSERRIHMKETDEDIAQKVISPLSVAMNVILCIGEPAKVREKGTEESKAYIKEQLEKGLSIFINQDSLTGHIWIAYEPIWAISTFKDAKPAKPKDAEEMISFIKNELKRYSFPINKDKKQSLPVLYGGSINSSNAKEFLGQPSIDGCLIGGASLDPREFVNIVSSLNDIN